MSGALVVAHVVIPEAELRWTCVARPARGSQNVNKVSSKIDLRFDVEQSSALSDELKARRRTKAAARLDADGQLKSPSQLTRNQPDNLEDAREESWRPCCASAIGHAQRRVERRSPAAPRRPSAWPKSASIPRRKQSLRSASARSEAFG